VPFDHGGGLALEQLGDGGVLVAQAELGLDRLEDAAPEVPDAQMQVVLVQLTVLTTTQTGAIDTATHTVSMRE